MAINNELKKIKKVYGENFMHLCRTLFPTILEEDGRLFEILTSTFAGNSRNLYEDIMDAGFTMDFRNYIMAQLEPKREKNPQVVEKTPYELLDEVGYNLFECKTERDIQRFKKYYAKNEQLCTFHGERLDSCLVFWAVKKNVGDIKRSDFKNPQREDEYGTSVMSIQFEKEGKCTVSIKNRYNHTVNNPDATYGNNLDNIALGLTISFAKLLKQRGLEFDSSNVDEFNLYRYVRANDGKYYKYNEELNGIYYCPGNIVIENGEPRKIENPESQMLTDYFIIDTKNKQIRLYDETVQDCFPERFKDIEGIEIVKNKEKKTKSVIISIKNQAEPVVIEINEEGQIVGYKDNSLTEVGDNFLHRTWGIRQLQMLNLRKSGNHFVSNSGCMQVIETPELEELGDYCLQGADAEELEFPKLRKAGSYFLFNTSDKLKRVKFLALEELGDETLEGAYELIELIAPKLRKTGRHFLYSASSLKTLETPELEELGDESLCNANKSAKLIAPRLKKVGEKVLSDNKKLSQRISRITPKDIAELDRNSQLTVTEVSIGRKIFDRLRSIFDRDNKNR